MKNMYENPVFRQYAELRESGADTWEFLLDKYLPEILRLAEAGELTVDVSHEGIRFAPVANETGQ